MATPAEIASGATCFRCVSDYEAAVLYLLSQIAGVAEPATIAANAACFDCIPNKQAAILYLLDTIAVNGTGGGGGGGGAAADIVTCADVDPVAAPTGTCAIWINRVSTAVFFWNSTTATWILKV